MENRRHALALRHMRTLFGVGAVGGQTDARLLDQFSTGHREAAEAAFTTLVERHGPMVFRVCRGVLGNSPDVHDAVQATFLVLVRHAGSLWVRDSLGPWLHGVALRVANKAKVAAARRRMHERRSAELADAARAGSSTPDDLAPALHDEIERLPGKIRAPIVLCYLEGQTHEGAAAALGWPVGTVRGRLARGRDLLRTRLVRRGVAPTAGAVVAILEAGEASAAPLSESLVHAVISLVAERPAGVAPAAVAALAEASIRMMTMAKLKVASILVLLGLVALGLTEVARAKFSGGRQEAAAQPATPPKAAVEQAKDRPETWPAGALVRGRVVDHQGVAVAGADVLLLGSEKLIVFVDRGQRPNTVRYSISTQPAAPPPSDKTDAQGRFSLRKPESPADRIAVVCERMLLWEVTRKEVPNADDLVITLPEPSELRIHADIPGKPEKLEYWIAGRPGRRVDWESDSIYYRGIDVPNPGERVVGPLPPAQYAVERLELTPTGIRTNQMNLTERRLLSVKPGKRTDSTFDRKTGRRIEGRVRGLEDVKLRYAFVEIHYLGPEEQFKPGGKASRLSTAFDVMPISSDGRFTTPPLPPNKYTFQLLGMKASTPAESGHEIDFQESVSVTVAETGAVAPVEIIVKPKAAPRAASRTKAADPKKPRLELRVRDESGSPVKDFEAQLFAQSIASREAAMGTDGLAIMAGDELKSWKYGDLIVYAPGFASTIEEIGSIEGLRKVDVTLKRGKKIRLRVRDAAGKPIPGEFMALPQVYLPIHRADAWAAAVIKDATMRVPTIAAINFLNVRREQDGDFSFNVRRDETAPIYFGFSHPEVLLYYERGPVAVSELAGGTWDVDIPQPATLEVSLKTPLDPGGKPLYAAGYYTLTSNKPGFENSSPVLESGELKEPEWRATLPRLAPGSYSVHIQTTPRDATTRPPGLEARPGVYYDRRKIELKPGERNTLAFQPAPLNTDAWRGKRAASILITPASDRPLGGETYRVSYVLPNYGRLPVAEGKLPSDARIVLEKIAPSGNEPFDGEYTVEVAETYLGKFAVKDVSERQTFSFRMAPRAGDLAPTGLGQDLETGQPVRCSDLRGRVVFVEFWATWCGPCREPMERLLELARRRGESWRNDVALVAIGIDKDREDLRRRVRQIGVTSIRQLWSPDDQAEAPGSAYADYAISSVPTSFLIGRDGRIIWRGHPASLELEQKIDELIGRKH